MAKHPTGTIHFNMNANLFGVENKYHVHNGIQTVAAVGLIMQEKAAKLRALMICQVLISFLVS